VSERRPNALVQLVLARLRSFYREPGVLFWSFGFPLVLAIALGIAFRNRPAEAVKVAIEASPEAASLEAKLHASKDVDASVLEPERANVALRTDKVSIVVVPGDPPTYRFDPTRPESRLARLIVDDALQRANGRTDTFTPKEAVLSEPGARYIDFLIPGLIGIGLMQSGLWGVGYVIVEMRTKKLMKRFVATPMKKRDFLLAFVLMRGLFLLVEIPVLLVFARFVFGVPIFGSVALLGAVAVLGSLAFAGLGLLVGSRAENVQTASGLINVASMPMFIGSGTFFSSARFPDAVQPFLSALPLTALNDSLRAIMLDGAGFFDIAPKLAVIAAWGVACFALSLKLFRWR
jgi:ABC-type multidrug transport system permease subunit